MCSILLAPDEPQKCANQKNEKSVRDIVTRKPKAATSKTQNTHVHTQAHTIRSRVETPIAIPVLNRHAVAY